MRARIAAAGREIELDAGPDTAIAELSAEVLTLWHATAPPPGTPETEPFGFVNTSLPAAENAAMWTGKDPADA